MIDSSPESMVPSTPRRRRASEIEEMDFETITPETREAGDPNTLFKRTMLETLTGSPFDIEGSAFKRLRLDSNTPRSTCSATKRLRPQQQQLPTIKPKAPAFFVPPPIVSGDIQMIDLEAVPAVVFGKAAETAATAKPFAKPGLLPALHDPPAVADRVEYRISSDTAHPPLAPRGNRRPLLKARIGRHL